MKNLIALLLALVLCLGILAGCQQTPAETSAPPAETTAPPATSDSTETTDATDPVEEGYTFPAGAELDIICGHDINDLPMDKFVEGATGLSIQWTPRGADDEITAKMTQKVTPSLIFGYGPAWGHEMGRYGALVNLYDWYEEMPNFFARYEVYGDTIKGLYETGEQELYSAPVFMNGDVQHFGWFYREDIFEDLNLKVPTNWQEILDVCAALKQAYPESYPITMRGLDGSMNGLIDMAQQFGVDYQDKTPALDTKTNTFYNPFTTDYARGMLRMLRSLIDLKYMDISVLSNSTADWVADLSSSKSFITFDKAFYLTNLEKAGQEVNPDFSLRWWNNIPLVESDLPYQCRNSRDYDYAWYITTKCKDVELAVRYLDWMYSDEGCEILSWGVKGESYGVDENGNKYFLEGYDATYNARLQESGYIDMKATAATYTPKCQEMIFDTMAAAAEGDFWDFPAMTWTNDEQQVISTYQVDWNGVKDRYWQKYLLGELDIDDDATWTQFKTDMAALSEAEIIAAYNAAYARYLNG